MKRKNDELMTRIMDGSLDDLNGEGREFAALKADLRSLRDSVPTPHLTNESLFQRIEAAKAKAPRVPLWQTGLRFGLAPAVVAALGFIAIRSNMVMAPLEAPVADTEVSTPRSDQGAVPTVAAAPQVAAPEPTSQVEKTLKEAPSTPVVRKTTRSTQPTLVRSTGSKKPSAKAEPIQKNAPMAAADAALVDATDEVPTNAVVIGNMTSETGTRLATEVEPTSDVVISG